MFFYIIRVYSSCIIVIYHRTVWNIQSLTFRNIQKYAIYFLSVSRYCTYTLKFFISIIHIKFQTITLQRFYNFYVARTNFLYIHFTIRKILRLIFLKHTYKLKFFDEKLFVKIHNSILIFWFSHFHLDISSTFVITFYHLNIIRFNSYDKINFTI